MEENKMSVEYWKNANGKVLTVNDLFANQYVMSIDPTITNPELKFSVEETVIFEARDASRRTLATYIMYNLKPITEKQPVDVYKLIVRFIDGYEPDVILGFLYDPNVVLNRHDIVSGVQNEWQWLVEGDKYSDVFAVPSSDGGQQFSTEEIFLKKSFGELHGTGMRFISKSTLEQVVVTLVEYFYSNTQVVRGIPEFNWQPEPPFNDKFYVIEWGGDAENSGVIDFIQARQVDGLHNVWLDHF